MKSKGKDFPIFIVFLVGGKDIRNGEKDKRDPSPRRAGEPASGRDLYFSLMKKKEEKRI